MTKPADGMVCWLDALSRKDVGRVGGKNASLGELINALEPRGIHVPPGFATTAEAYWHFIEANRLRPIIEEALAGLVAGRMTLAETGSAIRKAIATGAWPEDLAAEIVDHYAVLRTRMGGGGSVAVRSSATAEDLPDASFAGQQETILNVSGEQELLAACRRCYASLFTDRAISYRQAKGFDHLSVALSVGVQAMVRSDKGSAGVAFSIDTETGFDGVVVIDAAWGLGENVVQGVVNPDEYVVFKPFLADTSLTPILEKRVGTKERKMIYAADGHPTRNVPTSKVEREGVVLSDSDILTLGRWVVAIEAHYRCAMDVEWAKDGESGQLFIVQARPETVQSRRNLGLIRTYQVCSKGPVLVKGLAIGDAIVTGRTCLIETAADIGRFVDGSILVTGTTDPDWMPIMKRAAGIITDHGGRTSHAAIVSRELGLPAVVGTGEATRRLHDGQDVTLSCAEGDEGIVYDGIADFTSAAAELDAVPQTRTKIMINLANPAAAFRWWQLPTDGIGLARMEFVIGNHIRVHPMALLGFGSLKDDVARTTIGELTAGYADKADYFVDKLSQGLSRIAALAYPKLAIVRMSDFKTNEYAGLIGGAEFEPDEENPMLGFRGAVRYYSPAYREGFALECRAIRHLRDAMGFTNVAVMIPFCRSVSEADRVLAIMAENGLKRGENGLRIYVMCETPSNVVLAKEFAARFDGFSIGSNDLTQLTLGVDRGSEVLSDLFDEEDTAVKWMIEKAVSEAHRAGITVGLCGQAPSDHPEFARFLVGCGIDSISVAPDSFLAVKQEVAAAEALAGAVDERGRAPGKRR